MAGRLVDHGGLRSAAALAFVWFAITAAESRAQQAPAVRLAAPADCSTNPNCAPGLRKSYGIDPVLVPLAVPDAGINALDDGLAELAVAFSSNPQLSRPDVVTLRDDRRMIGADHVTPIVRSATLRRFGRPLRRRLNATSQLLNTLALRGLNQQVIDGRMPEAVGGEFADANGLGGESGTRRGPRVVVGYQDFAENETLAHLYGAALRGAGYRVVVRSVRGLRKEAVSALRAGRIDVYPGYAGSLLEYLGGSSLRSALARIKAVPLARARAQDRNVFAMKGAKARELGISKLSDLARFWPAASSRAVARAAVDERQSEQWAVSPESVLDLPDAWALSQGVGVTVAIVDSGIKLDHPDLAPNAWTNFAEVPGNGVDDDGNGYVDDVHGVDLTTTKPGQDVSDGHGHGTHVAGIVAAAANGRGVVGVAPRAKVMAVKVLTADGGGTTGAEAEGIRYAAANGARVINVSIQGDDPDPRLNAAVAAAAAANSLVVVSAGNSARNIDTQPSYPAAIPAPNLIGVAATAPDSGRALDVNSNFGRLTVQLAAPGQEILSTANSGSFEFKSGTSMAAPMVSGVAALMASVNPRITAEELRGLLLQSAARATLPVGAGYVDALASAVAATTATSYGTTQAPQLRVLRATTKASKIQLQAALLGSPQAIATYRVSLDGKRVADLRAGRSPFSITLRKRGKVARIDALNASGQVLATTQRRVAKLRVGKRGVRGGRSIGTNS
jgi:subtilisin family serine protease